MYRIWVLLACAVLWHPLPACGGDDGGGDDDSDADADADADSDADSDGDSDADSDADECSLDCSELDGSLDWDQQSALPTCEDNDTWTDPPAVSNVQRDGQDRVVHWEIAIHYENNHLFVIRYDVASFCPDGAIEEMSVEAESYDPMGTWSCQQIFFCL